jgi:hypothetical protein
MNGGLGQSVSRILGMAALGAAVSLYAGSTALAQTNVGVSISVQQPGVYGRIDIGNYPNVQVVYPQPVVIVPGPVAVQRQPIYLYVPPRHQRGWDRYCGRYNACGQPVYFVQEQWVQEQRNSGRDHESHGDGDRGHGRDKKRNKRHDD